MRGNIWIPSQSSYPTVLVYWDTLKNIHYPFGTNGKLMVLGVPILKHFRVLLKEIVSSFQKAKSFFL